MPDLATLSGTFGVDFERSVQYLLLYDDDFAATFSSASDPELYGKGSPARCLAESYSSLYATHGKTPTFATLLADIHERMAALPDTSPRKAEWGRARILLVALSKRTHPDADLVQFIRGKMAQFITVRKLGTALLESAALLQQGDHGAAVKAVQDAYDEATRTTALDLGSEHTSMATKLQLYKRQTKASFHIPLNIPLLDQVMRGGLEPKKLGFFLAPTGVGKTLAMVHAGAVAAANGLNVVHITLEIDRIETHTRYDARLTGQAINTVAKHALDKRVLNRIIDATKALSGKLRVKEWGSDEASVNDIRALLKGIEQREGWKPNLVLVDYADLLRPYKQQRERRWELADTVRTLRQIAKEFNCAIWTASQTGKASFKAETLSLADVWESLEKVQVADVVLGLCQTQSEKQKDDMRIIVLKNRLGGHEGAQVECKVTPETHLIVQSPHAKTLKWNSAYKATK